MTGKQRFLAAANCKQHDKTPIWIMRQAGRYLPEYRKLKEQYSFLEMVKTPELATLVTTQPLKRFDLDAAILFSDILVIPEALGLPYSFREQGGIQMEYSINSQADIDKLNAPDCVEEKLTYVPQALKLIQKELSGQALLGFGGSPWTLAAYMIEGGSSTDFTKLLALPRENPKAFESLMQKLTSAAIHYFKMQIDAGIDAIQIFDTWGSLCTPENYYDYSLKWINQIIDSIPSTTPIILYAKGAGAKLTQLFQTKAKVLSLDWTTPLKDAIAQAPRPFAFQGNLNPDILSTGTTEEVKAEAEIILSEMADYPGHIFNLGHGIKPNAKIENVQTLVETVHNFNLANV